MSDISPGGRAPDPAYPTGVPSQPAYVDPAYDLTPEYSTAPGYTTAETQQVSGGETSKPRQVAEQARDSAGQAAADVKDTAKEQAQRVGAEARTQASNVASEVRGKINEQARNQNTRLVGSIRQTADHLDEMRGAREDSPAAAVVARVAEGGRQFADYLDRNGPDGVLKEVEDFARRRPGAFLATALAAGFVVGRLGKSVAKADSDAGKPSTDTFRPGYDETQAQYQQSQYRATEYTEPVTPAAGYQQTDPGYVPVSTGSGYVTPATTEYTSTGTGTPAVVQETYLPGDPERRS
jgi:vacuolar-type H+-ATPase subunit H